MIRRSRGSKDSGDWPELSAKVVPELWPQQRLKHIFQTGRRRHRASEHCDVRDLRNPPLVPERPRAQEVPQRRPPIDPGIGL